MSYNIVTLDCTHVVAMRQGLDPKSIPCFECEVNKLKKRIEDLEKSQAGEEKKGK